MESKAIQLMPIDRPECDPQARERFDEESLIGLAQSIKESGVLQPLLVRRDGERFVVVEGERRLRACRKAGIPEVPVIIDDRELDEVEVTLRQLVLNTQRENLSSVERGRAFVRLMRKAGWTAAETARRIGLSEATISRDTALLTLPPEVVRRVNAGEIPPSTAYQIALAGDAISQTQLANEAANGHLTRDRVAQRVRPRRKHVLPSAANRNGRSRGCVVLPLGDGRSINVSDPSLTLQAFIEKLHLLLKRIGQMEPSDMSLVDAAGLLAANNS
jgi:ParB/RepB/Spo0J family partition protein